MKTSTNLKSAAALAVLLALGACGDMPPANNGASYPSSPQPNYPNGVNQNYGVVQSIELVQQASNSSGLGVGTLAGAVVGGIIGNQVGSGGARPAATVLGAAGGAYAGHQLEKRNQQQSSDEYKITVRMRDNSYQSVIQTTSADLRVGDRVVIDNGVARRY